MLNAEISSLSHSSLIVDIMCVVHVRIEYKHMANLIALYVSDSGVGTTFTLGVQKGVWLIVFMTLVSK